MRTKRKSFFLAKSLIDLKFDVVATKGTAMYLRARNIHAKIVHKISESASPDAIQLMKEGKVNLVINIPSDKQEYGMAGRKDGYSMRRTAVELQIPYISNISAARATIEALKIPKHQKLRVTPLSVNKKL